MEKIMPLDLLASIKGARSSEAVAELFNVIKEAIPVEGDKDTHQPVIEHIVTVEHLRNDEVKECTGDVKDQIRANFPKEKDGFLVVPKVIDD